MKNKYINFAKSKISRLWRLLDKIQPTESTLLGVSAFCVGLLSGAGVWIFKMLIDLSHKIAFEEIGSILVSMSPWLIILIPISGGFLVGMISFFLLREEKHHGVAGIMESVAMAGGRLRYKRTPIKVTASAIGIGFGASVGPEDPSVQIGANLGSMFGQLLHLSDERVRTLVAAGAAGGVAAAFNAPIAGVFFALELIVGELSGNLFSIVIASVISAVFTQAVSGQQPAFHVPAYAFNSIWELPLYLGLGILAGPLAAIYIRTLYKAQDMYVALNLPRWLRPAFAGLFIGIIGIFLPEIFGVGYETIEKILNRQTIPTLFLVTLLVAKLIMTPVSIGGGFLGGVFAPSLFLGATLGAAYGQISQYIFPSLQIEPAAFAMVGMAAVLAGAVHAPLTAIILLFEMTHDYRIILPLMFAVAVSIILSQRFQSDSVYTLGLARKGIRLQRGRDVEVLEALSVGEIMQKEIISLKESDLLKYARELFINSRHHGMPVVNQSNELIGVLTVQDIDRYMLENKSKTGTVGEACTRNPIVTFPSESIGAALRRMSVRDIGRLPVVDFHNQKLLLGMLRRTDLVRAYDVALGKRAAMQHKAHQVRLGTFSGVQIEEIRIGRNSKAEGKKISEIQWPRDCVIASLRRGRLVLIPHGDTVLKAEDELVVVVEEVAENEIRKICSSQNNAS